MIFTPIECQECLKLQTICSNNCKKCTDCGKKFPIKIQENKCFYGRKCLICRRLIVIKNRNNVEKIQEKEKHNTEMINAFEEEKKRIQQFFNNEILMLNEINDLKINIKEFEDKELTMLDEINNLRIKVNEQQKKLTKRKKINIKLQEELKIEKTNNIKLQEELKIEKAKYNGKK